MNKQTKAILILVVILIAGGLGYVFLSNRFASNEQNTTNQPLTQPEQQKNQESDSQEVEVITSNIDTSDWKIYRNEELGFEFRYPRQWKLKEIESGVELTIPNIDNIPLLEMLGRIIIQKESREVDKLVQGEKERLSNVWLKEVGIEREVTENRVTIKGNEVVVLGPFSPPSNMSEELYVIIDNKVNTVVISGVIFGGDRNLIKKKIESIYNSLTFL